MKKNSPFGLEILILRFCDMQLLGHRRVKLGRFPQRSMSMENRRLGQSDRGRGRTKQHRARRLLGLTLACCVALSVSSCSAPVESDEHSAEVEQKITGNDAAVVYGATGVVDFTITYTIEGVGSYPVSCTGSMIAPHVVLTAARCFLPFPVLGTYDGELQNVAIHYYDPQSGRRTVHEGPAHWAAYPGYPGSAVARGILNEANRARNDPKRWRQLLHSVLANWFTLPSYREAINWAFTAKNDLAVLVVPAVLGSPNYEATDYHDYLRLYSGDPDLLQNGEKRTYGAGLTDQNGHSDDQLRYGDFNAELEDGYLKLEGREGGNSLKMCRGDSGGPFEYNVSVGGQSVPMIAGVWSNFNTGGPFGGGPYCAGDTKGHDDSYVCHMEYSDHVHWLESVTGISCASQSGGSQPYRRCFDLPFIEDVPGEGLYELNVATAIAMSTPQ